MSKKINLLIPREDFEKIYNSLWKSNECRHIGCRYLNTRCRLREAIKELRQWWQQTNGNAPGFTFYEIVLERALQDENVLFMAFRSENRQQTPYDKLSAEIKKEAKNTIGEKTSGRQNAGQTA